MSTSKIIKQEKGSVFPPSLQAYLNYIVTVLLTGFLLFIFYEDKLAMGQACALGLLQLVVLRCSKAKLQGLGQASESERSEAYYGALVILYINLFFILSLYISCFLWLLPEGEFSTNLLTINNNRLRIGLYVFGALLLVYARKFYSLSYAIAAKDVIPRYFYKGMTVMFHRSLFYRYYYVYQSFLLSAMAIQMFWTICRYTGHSSLYLNSPLPYITALLLGIYFLLVLHCLIYFFMIFRRLVKRYEEKFEHLEKKNK